MTERHYFCVKLTSNEHDSVEWELRELCKQHDGYELIYYRQLKDGHVPMYREVKIQINSNNRKPFYDFMNSTETYTGLDMYIERNPHKVQQ